MLELKTKQKLSSEAFSLARSFSLVNYRDTIYLPMDYETKLSDPAPEPERTMWQPLSTRAVRDLAAKQFDTLFANDGELRSFEYMTAQSATHVHRTAPVLLIKTEKGLAVLEEDGSLGEPTGQFLPNTVEPMLNEDPVLKARLFDVITEWVDSEEDAHSLLYHLATCLAPSYSAVKYVLLIGEGRNGKSTLLKMLMALFGKGNVSKVTRQQISEQSPVVCELNGKLLNLVFDGQAEYLKDSATEKTLIAGETATIRKLYESIPTEVQTNALYVEGLNKEPKSSDKSTALQKRLSRFLFPNYYPQDYQFERAMLEESMLGAFLSLLIDHFVPADEVAKRLAPTQRAVEMQLEHMFVNSIALQFLKYVEEQDPMGVAGLLGTPFVDIVAPFQSWRIKENDLRSWPEPDVVGLFGPLFHSERKSVRVNGSPRKVRVITALKDEAAAFVLSLKGDTHAAIDATVVAE